MDLSKVLVQGQLFPVAKAEIDALSQQFNVPFPSGYSEFMQTFGSGELSEIRVLPPTRLLNENNVDSWRSMVSEGWFFDNEPKELTVEKALECYLVADTQSGDEFIFHPSSPDEIFVLPRYDRNAVRIQGGLDGLFKWYVESPLMLQPTQWTFSPYPPS